MDFAENFAAVDGFIGLFVNTNIPDSRIIVRSIIAHTRISLNRTTHHVCGIQK